jgi:alpha-glucosidase
VLANHDVHRAATRFAADTTAEVGLARARAAALVVLALPGAVYIYNGDELGLPDAPIPPGAWQDPRPPAASRDPERVPMPWSGDAPPFGFSTNPHTWLPMPDEWSALTVDVQDSDPSSTLQLYRAAIALRKSHADFGGTEGADLEWVDAPDGCLAFRRGSIVVILNAGDSAVPMPAGELLLASAPVGAELPAASAAWLLAPR